MQNVIKYNCDTQTMDVAAGGCVPRNQKVRRDVPRNQKVRRGRPPVSRRSRSYILIAFSCIFKTEALSKWSDSHPASFLILVVGWLHCWLIRPPFKNPWRHPWRRQPKYSHKRIQVWSATYSAAYINSGAGSQPGGIPPRGNKRVPDG